MADTGYIIKNGIIYSGGGGGDTGVELTQEEFDALTQEEKDNGTTYYITDATPSTLNAEMVKYGSSNVKDKLDSLATSVSSNTSAISSLNSTMTSKLKCVQEGLEVFVGTTAINIVQGQITQTSNLQSAILQATGWTQIDSVICNIQASVPVFLNYANGVFYAYSINGTYNNVGVNYVAFGHK